jgi:hypothetical protein
MKNYRRIWIKGFWRKIKVKKKKPKGLQTAIKIMLKSRS